MPVEAWASSGVLLRRCWAAAGVISAPLSPPSAPRWWSEHSALSLPVFTPPHLDTFWAEETGAPPHPHPTANQRHVHYTITALHFLLLAIKNSPPDLRSAQSPASHIHSRSPRPVLRHPGFKRVLLQVHTWLQPAPSVMEFIWGCPRTLWLTPHLDLSLSTRPQ
ncbi:hypothetical protein DPEC_G00311390 [Dallia pectoralis]|uniref:Uncharacterized protein n=1 Tax=Dallia pectoralis TaxID=75939 RepID=A0ACC2FBB4_DALPE|nr:hypothetical protein DPEC_G00311390 [Dallia pectoralis]